eukprot:Em0008g290a
MPINIKYSQGGYLPGLTFLLGDPSLGQRPDLVCRSLSGWPTPPSGACLPESPPNDLWPQGLPTGDQRHSREFPTANRSGLAESQLRGVLALAPNQSTGHVLTEAYSWGT